MKAALLALAVARNPVAVMLAAWGLAVLRASVTRARRRIAAAWRAASSFPAELPCQSRNLP